MSPLQIHLESPEINSTEGVLISGLRFGSGVGTIVGAGGCFAGYFGYV